MTKFLYMAAPLEDVSDNVFRELCFNHGADLTFTEMVRLESLVRNNKSTIRKIEFQSKAPTQIQLAAQKESDLKSFLKDFNPPEGFKGINFNLGCPSPHLIRIGLGCALIKRVSKVERLIQIVKDHGFPCSIKMRLGLNRFEKEKKTYLNLLKNSNPDFFVVHARHGMEHYESVADYSVYSECVETGKTIIANGDIDSVEKVNHLKELGVKGVMIGRAAVRNPAIFEQLKGLPMTNFGTLKKEYLTLTKKYPQINKKYYDNVMKRLGTNITNFSDNISG